jgi:peptide/nickel transport system permease protein
VTAARGFATLLITLAGLLLVTFVVGRVMPIDPVVAAVGDKASAETYAKAREALGLDQPVWIQFGRYIGGVAHGDLGRSSVSGRPVSEDIARVFPATVELSTLGILVGIILGVPLGGPIRSSAAYRCSAIRRRSSGLGSSDC